MLFHEQMELFLDLAEARLQAHSQRGQRLHGLYQMLVRSDRTNRNIKYPVLSLQPDTATPRDARLSGALTVDRDWPLRLVAQIDATNPNMGWMDCLKLASLAQEAILIDPKTGEEDPELRSEGEEVYAAFSMKVGNLLMPVPIRGQLNKYQSVAFVEVAMEEQW